MQLTSLFFLIVTQNIISLREFKIKLLFLMINAKNYWKNALEITTLQIYRFAKTISFPVIQAKWIIWKKIIVFYFFPLDE